MASGVGSGRFKVGTVIKEPQPRFHDKFVATARLRLARGLTALGSAETVEDLLGELRSLESEAQVIGYAELIITVQDCEADARAWRDSRDPSAQVRCARGLRRLARQIDDLDAAHRSGGPGGGDAIIEREPEAHRALVIDDSEVVCEQLCHALAAAGFLAEAALGVPSAIRKVAEHRPHIILVDVNMPGVDNCELVEVLRDRAVASVTILLVSALSQDQLRAQVERVGADGAVTKGGGLARIVDRVREMLTEARP